MAELLLEDGGFLLLEDGGVLLLEESYAPTPTPTEVVSSSGGGGIIYDGKKIEIDLFDRKKLALVVQGVTWDKIGSYESILGESVHVKRVIEIGSIDFSRNSGHASANCVALGGILEKSRSIGFARGSSMRIAQASQKMNSIHRVYGNRIIISKACLDKSFGQAIIGGEQVVDLNEAQKTLLLAIAEEMFYE